MVRSKMRKQEICIICNKSFYKYRKCLRFCSRQCSSKNRKIKDTEEYRSILRDRIKAKSNICMKTECWLWNRYKNKEGRGYCHYKSTTIPASRVSYIAFKGYIYENLDVCHTCDNPSCVNPEHLFLGTDQDNANDRENKERGAKGEKIKLSKLKNEMISEIRNSRRDGMSQQKIADKYNVSQTAISRVLSKKTWKHI